MACDDADRIVLPLLGLVAGTVLLRVLYGPPALGYDSNWALLWGDQLAGLERPNLDAPVAPTPHPLVNLLAVLLSPFGDRADDVLGLISLATLAMLGGAAYALGRAVLSPLVGVAFAAIVLTRPLIITQTLVASADIGFLALVVLAAALVARSGGPAPAAGVALAVAGLLRPEAWLLGALWAALAWHRGRGVLAGAVFALPALIWAGLDLALTGNPLHSLTETRGLASELDRPQGLGTAVELLPTFLEDILGLAVLLGGLAGLAVALGPLRTRATPVLALLGVGLAAYLAIGLAGLAVVMRYALLPAVALSGLCAAVLVAWRVVPSQVRLPTGALAVGTALALIVSMPAQIGAVDRAVEDGHERAALRSELLELLERRDVARAIELCDPLTLVNYRIRPVVASALDRPPEGLPTVADRAPARGGSLLVPTALSVRRGFQVDPGWPERTAVTVPGDHRPIAANTRWRLLADCPEVRPR